MTEQKHIKVRDVTLDSKENLGKQLKKIIESQFVKSLEFEEMPNKNQYCMINNRYLVFFIYV